MRGLKDKKKHFQMMMHEITEAQKRMAEAVMEATNLETFIKNKEEKGTIH